RPSAGWRPRSRDLGFHPAPPPAALLLISLPRSTPAAGPAPALPAAIRWTPICGTGHPARGPRARPRGLESPAPIPPGLRHESLSCCAALRPTPAGPRTELDGLPP